MAFRFPWSREWTVSMRVNWFEFAQRLAEGARAKVAEDRRLLEESAEQKADTQGRSEVATSAQ